MVIPDKVYNIIKWACIIAVPAFASFFSEVAPQWGMSQDDVFRITKTLYELATLIGSLFLVNDITYKKKYDVISVPKDTQDEEVSNVE